MNLNQVQEGHVFSIREGHVEFEHKNFLPFFFIHTHMRSRRNDVDAWIRLLFELDEEWGAFATNNVNPFWTAVPCIPQLTSSPLLIRDSNVQTIIGVHVW